MKIIVSTLLAAGALAVSACAPVQTAEPAPGSDTAFKACKVSDYQSYVGRNRSTIPTAPAGQTFRVLCTTCAATMDYREDRLTIVFDANTQVIQSARCG